ncbi:glycosyltransferase [Psychrobacter glacincola]|uniref:Glycosyltransferase n=1 Tax=Psychrobacter glacincola TaxID=56810 RepID=A0ABW1W1U0_9GAMM|nr:glycosyltransferase [Psychrobacter glacincola]
MNKPIILLILKALEGRGAERMVTTLAAAYLEIEYSVHVLCLESTRDMRLDSRVHYHVVAYNQPLLETEIEQAAAYKKVAARIDDYVLSHVGAPELILANIYKVNWIMAYSNLPNIVNVLHTAVSRQFQEKLATMPAQTMAHLKMVYGAHPCSCVSDGARQDLLALIGNVNKTTTIYNPCDVSQIQQLANEPFSIQRFGLNDKGYIIHVASFDAMKGHRELLQAYAKTERKLPLVLVGKGRLEDEIKQLAIELRIEHKVYFVGFYANPYPLIANAALLVMTSKYEGFGYVIVEAQALGVPVISTDCPFGPKELLPQKNLIAVGDIQGLAALINKALDNTEPFITPLNQQLLPTQIAQQYLDFMLLTKKLVNDS